MRLTVGQIIGKTLKAYGVPYVAGLPGHGNWSMIDAFNDPVSKLPFIQVMHEQSAVHIADAHYRATGQPIAACTSIGPGATNTIIGLATAHCDSTALLLITGSAATHMRGHGVMQELDRSASPDFPHIAAPVTKRTFDVIRADQVPFVLHRAWNAMLTGRPGPVHMELPLDVQVETTDIDVAELSKRLPFGKVRADAQAIEVAISLLLSAKRPCIVAGGGAISAECTPELTMLVEKLGIPVVFTWNGKGAIAEDNPMCAGTAGWPGSLPGNNTAANADVVMSLGCRFTDWSSSSYRKGVTFSIPDAKLIQVDIDAREIGKNYPAEVGIAADCKLVLADRGAGTESPRVTSFLPRQGGRIEAGVGKETRATAFLQRHPYDDAAHAAGTAQGPASAWHRDCGIGPSPEYDQAGLPGLRAENTHHLRLVFVHGICASGGDRRQAGETRCASGVHHR
jgi:acetolactate synthase I/II/III large subunit